MELWEVERYGLDSFSDPQYVCIYGMPPAEWYRRGVRLLARTTVEAVRDELGEMIGRDGAKPSEKLLRLTRLHVIIVGINKNANPAGRLLSRFLVCARRSLDGVRCLGSVSKQSRAHGDEV